MATPLAVLIIEDSADDAELVSRFLAREGFEPSMTRVETAEAMRQALDRGSWDLVIADHNMPRFSSSGALEVLRASALDLPFLIVSGSIGEEAAVEAMRAGAHDYILKSNLARLGPAVERELRDAEVRRARRAAEHQLAFHRRHDGLTGLVNRREFEDRVSRTIESVRAGGPPAAVCFLDVDGFRAVNDTCGHAAGDDMLRQIARVLEGAVAAGDTVGRLGGDEFAVLLSGCPADAARQRAQELLAELGGSRFRWLGRVFEAAASVGVATIGQGDEAVDQVLGAANAACCTAKEHGGRRVHVYHVEDLDLSRRRNESSWVPRLVEALETGRLRLFHQRLLPLGEVAGRDPLCEVLLRFVDEQGELVTPAEFIGPAERFNLMPTVDRWVVDHALEALAPRAGAGCGDRGCRMLINLSGSSIGDETFPDFVAECFDRRRVSPSAVGFELTETAVVRDLLHARTFMQALGGLGCRFALDDFGSGMSSFAYLRALPVHLLKVDGSFVREMVADDLARAIVEAVHRVASAVGLETVAECVEDERTLALVRELGLDHAQGYAVHRPEAI